MLTKAEILSGFQKIPLTPSRIIMVHSAYKSLGGVEGGAETIINALLDFVGPEGTVLFPTFNFHEWTERHYFDISETLSKMGIIGEVARQREDALRTPHPIFSFAALGKEKERFAKCDDVRAYGSNSVFGLFHKLNGVIISIGLHWNSTFSMHHYVEYHTGCDYRRTKHFSGIYVDNNGEPTIKTYTMHVRKDFDVITDIEEGMDDLFSMGVIKDITVGNAIVHYSTAQAFFDNMSVIVKNNPEKLHKIKTHQY